MIVWTDEQLVEVKQRGMRVELDGRILYREDDVDANYVIDPAVYGSIGGRSSDASSTTSSSHHSA